MKILCIKLYSIFINKSRLFSTVLNISVTQQIKPDSVTKVIHCIRTRNNISGSLWLILLQLNLPRSVGNIYRVVNLKVDRILIWVICLLRFTTCYITHLTCIYSKWWKWYPFISMHLSTRLRFLSKSETVSRNFLIIFAIALFTGAYLLNFSKKLCLQWA